jgi:hypothetical protein
MTFNLDIDVSNFVDIEKLLEIIKMAQKLGHTKFHLVSINPKQNTTKQQQFKKIKCLK